MDRLSPSSSQSRGFTDGVVPLFTWLVKNIPAFSSALLLLLAGCATTAPREVLSTPGHTVIVTAFEPIVRGVNVGTTVFQNRGWETSPEAFDANETAMAAVPKVLLQPIVLIDGRTANLAMKHDKSFNSDEPDQSEFVRQLAELSRAQKADRIVVLTTGEASDWIAGTNQRLSGLGLYRREFLGMKRLQVYGVFQLRVFDCRIQKFIASDTLPGAREVYSIAWHESWPEFPVAEQRRLLAALTELVKEQTAQLLTRAGLANVPQPEASITEILLFRPNRPKSWLPEGNVLPIPKGLTPARARGAVVNGLKSRGWTVVSETDEQVVGLYRDGKKEAGVTARLSVDEIQLVANDHEIAPDGSRVAVAPYTRWQNNLKESIYSDLLDAEEALAPATSAPR